jgi:hypothetical protein
VTRSGDEKLGSIAVFSNGVSTSMPISPAQVRKL